MHFESAILIKMHVYGQRISQKMAYLTKRSFLKSVLPMTKMQKQSLSGALWKRCSWKFRKISQENTRARASFLIKLQAGLYITLLKKRLWHRCVHVNFAKFIRTPFLTEYLRWLLHKILSSQIALEIWFCIWITFQNYFFFALQLYWNNTSAWMFSCSHVNLLIFNTFS